MLNRLAPLLALLALCCAPPAAAQVEHELNPPQARWGIYISTLDGREVLARNADKRFQPASIAKLLTTAAAFHTQPDPRIPDPSLATTIRIEHRAEGGPPDIAIIGGGDPFLADDPECPDNCLSNLADIITGHGISEISDVIGDDTLFPDQRYADGWSIEDLKFKFATATSALTINENVLNIDVAPGDGPGAPVIATWAETDDLMGLRNEAATVAGYRDHLRISRLPNAGTMRLHGEFGANARPVELTIGIDDPAEHTARRLARLLRERGVTIHGVPRARHRPAVIADEPHMRDVMRGDPTPPRSTTATRPNSQEIARQLPAPLIDVIEITNKDSHNLFAEVLLRRVGLANGGSGSTWDGVEEIKDMLALAGAAPSAFDIADGAGLSIYNRISPRALTQHLVWASRQSWFGTWRATLPVGGEDGSLQYRFRRAPLRGNITAKTGSLSGVRSLAGYMTAASGRTLAFTVIVNDLPSEARSPITAIDALLADVAAAN